MLPLITINTVTTNTNTTTSEYILVEIVNSYKYNHSLAGLGVWGGPSSGQCYQSPHLTSQNSEDFSVKVGNFPKNKEGFIFLEVFDNCPPGQRSMSDIYWRSEAKWHLKARIKALSTLVLVIVCTMPRSEQVDHRKYKNSDFQSPPDHRGLSSDLEMFQSWRSD